MICDFRKLWLCDLDTIERSRYRSIFLEGRLILKNEIAVFCQTDNLIVRSKRSLNLVRLYRNRTVVTDKLPDNGFTERVMQQLPSSSRSSSLLKSRLWTVFCIVIAVTLFVLLRGWQLVAYGLVMMLNTPPTNQQLLTMLFSLVVAGMLIVGEVMHSRRLLQV